MNNRLKLELGAVNSVNERINLLSLTLPNANIRLMSAFGVDTSKLNVDEIRGNISQNFVDFLEQKVKELQG